MALKRSVCAKVATSDVMMNTNFGAAQARKEAFGLINARTTL
jgi:hypothetical protein